MMSSIYYKYALFTGLAVILVGCTVSLQEIEDDKNDGGVKDQTELCYFNAYIDNGPVTRTFMGELSDGKYPVLWSKGDKVLFGGSSMGKQELELIEGAGSTKAVFRGRLWTRAYNKKPDYVIGIYPSDGAKYSNDYLGIITDGKAKAYGYKQTMTAVLPSVQTYQTGTFASNVLPMIGRSENCYDFNFENIGAVLQLPVKGTGKISKIILTGNDGEALAGEFKVQFNYLSWSYDKNGDRLRDYYWTVDYLENEIAEDDKESACGRLITPVSDNSTGYIIVDCGTEGLQLDTDQPTVINIAMLPRTFKNGFSVRFIDYSGSSFVKSTKQSITLKRSYVKTMEEFDYQKLEPLEPANCYVVDKAGYYMIPAFCMGNRPISARLDVDEDGTNNATGNKVAADYLWTDTPGAVSQIEYISGKDGYISFKVNPDKDGNAPRGNTVVALYDSVTKEILWSWHIWMSEYSEVVTSGNCGGGVSTADGFISEASRSYLIIMDRNLGATSANKNDGVKTYGLYYQCGRKDPFVGANSAGGDDESLGIYLNENHQDKLIPSYNNFEVEKFGAKTNYTEWNTNLTTGWTYNNNFITAIYGYQHPMEFASSWEKNKDARWTTKEINQTEPFISNGGHEDFWNRTKTINDPCPAGWTILGERNGSFHANVKFTKDTTFFYTEKGVYGIEVKYRFTGTKYPGGTSTVWWPASGFRSVDGTIGNLGQGGYYWYYDHIDVDHGGHGWSFIKVTKEGKDKDGNKYTYSIYESQTDDAPMTCHASVVRCVKAKQSQD